MVTYWNCYLIVIVNLTQQSYYLQLLTINDPLALYSTVQKNDNLEDTIHRICLVFNALYTRSTYKCRPARRFPLFCSSTLISAILGLWKSIVSSYQQIQPRIWNKLLGIDDWTQELLQIVNWSAYKVHCNTTSGKYNIEGTHCSLTRWYARC